MMNIRPFNSTDRDALAKIYLKCRQETFHWMPKDKFQESDFDKDTEGEKIWIATLNAKPIGFIAIWMPDSFIHHLFIDPEFQHKSAGKQLLTEGLKNIGRPARLKCLIQNSKACQFYEKNGWQIESTAPVGPMGPYHTYVLLA